MIVTQKLPLNVAYTIFSKLFSDTKTKGLRSIPTLQMVVLTEFFYVDVDRNIHPKYFSSSTQPNVTWCNHHG